MQHNIGLLHMGFHRLPLHRDLVLFGVHLIPNLGDSPIDAHFAGRDHLLRLAPGGNAAVGEHFL